MSDNGQSDPLWDAIRELVRMIGLRDGRLVITLYNAKPSKAEILPFILLDFSGQPRLGLNQVVELRTDGVIEFIEKNLAVLIQKSVPGHGNVTAEVKCGEIRHLRTHIDQKGPHNRAG